MKRKLFIPLFTITLLLLGSCNKEELNQKVQMQSITLKTSTRSPDGNNEDVWRNGDKIAVFAQHYQAKYFKYDEANWQPTDGETFYGEVPGVFFGVSPASMNSDFIIPTDQSTVEKLRDADYMSSDNVELADNKQPLDLVFKHRLAKVEITITQYKSEFGGNIPTVVTPNFSAYTRLVRQSDGSTMLPNQSHNIITPLFTKDNSQSKHKFEVLIAPGDYEKKFTCVVNSKVLSSTLPSNLEEGKTYRFNLTVGNDIIQLSTPRVNDFGKGWSDEVAIDFGQLKVGDYLYSDGTWGELDKGRMPIGLVFSTTTSEIDKAAGYRKGYAISMSFAKIGDNVDFAYKTSNEVDAAIIDYLNSSWEDKVANKDGRTETLLLNESEHPAIKAALSYQPPLASSPIPQASEWFVPSLGQWHDIIVNLAGVSFEPGEIYGHTLFWPTVSKNQLNNINKYFSDWKRSEYSDIAFELSGYSWWTSSQAEPGYHFKANFIQRDGWEITHEQKQSKQRVRPAIAF